MVEISTAHIVENDFSRAFEIAEQLIATEKDKIELVNVVKLKDSILSTLRLQRQDCTAITYYSLISSTRQSPFKK